MVIDTQGGRMKISARSWHYRWMRWFYADTLDNHVPRSLCTYFWALVFSPLVALAVGAFAIALLTILLPVLGVGELHDRRQRKRGHLPPKGPGLVRSFVKAKKRKICPLIEVER
jgi:hypothetical protein